MSTSVIHTERLQFTPPGGTVQVITHVVTSDHVGRATGTIKVAATTAGDTARALPAGPYKKLTVLNRLNGQNIKLLLNAVLVMELPPGGEFSYAVPVAPGAVPIASCSIKNVGQQVADAEIDYFLFD